MFLESIGFRPVVQASYRAVASEGSSVGRVVRAEGRVACVLDDTGEERALLVPNRLVTEDSFPVAGDWVVFHPRDAVVTLVLPRTSVLARRKVGKRESLQVVAANVDRVVIVMGLDGDFSLRRLSRYLALAHGHGIRATVLLTKAGIVVDVEEKLASTRTIAGAVEVHAIDVLSGIGIDEVAALAVPGDTLVLVGSSGVGKSTLVNHWLGRDAASTGAVRTSDGTGRHTTTRRELHVLPSGAVLLDTPGMREVALVGDEAGIDATFADVASFAEACRFRDCNHEGEPGCAVRKAVDDGALDRDRVHEAGGLRDELGRNERRRAEKARGRSVARGLREVLRLKGRID